MTTKLYATTLWQGIMVFKVIGNIEPDRLIAVFDEHGYYDLRRATFRKEKVDYQQDIKGIELVIVKRRPSVKCTMSHWEFAYPVAGELTTLQEDYLCELKFVESLEKTLLLSCKEQIALIRQGIERRERDLAESKSRLAVWETHMENVKLVLNNRSNTQGEKNEEA